jgi:type I restriction enzyme, S subunit
VSARDPVSLPPGWTTPPVYARFSVQLGKMLDEKKIAGTHLAPYLRNVDVQWDRVNTDDLPEMDFSAEDRERFTLRNGDLLVCEGGEVGRTAIWDGRLAECYFQKAIHRLRPITEHDEPRFFRYFMRTAVESGLFALATASTIQHLPAEKLRLVRYPSPPRLQQIAIANYLDRETARLDALVLAKERVLGLLTDKRLALITRAVTRGPDLATPLRDSGIPWLGEIPTHWEARRLKHISPNITVGVVVNPSSYVTVEGVPFLYGSDITEDGITLDGVRRLPMRVSRGELAKTCLKPGDVVTVRVGAPGVTAVVPPELDGANCASIMLIRGSANFDSHWLAYAMNSAVGRSQVGLVQYGAAQEQFNISHAVDFWFAVPPLDEQRELVGYLARATSKLDELRAATMRTIELLKERRAALIARAVTGQTDVVEVAA